jgi:hypothetical protein
MEKNKINTPIQPGPTIDDRVPQAQGSNDNSQQPAAWEGNSFFFWNNTIIYYSNEQYMVEIYKLSSAITK